MVHQTGPLWNTIIQQLLLIIGWTVKNNYLMNCHEILYRIVWPPEDTADNTADFSDPLIFLLALLDQLFLCAGSNTFHSWSLKLYLNDCGDPLTFLPWHHDIFAFYWNITNGLTEIWNSWIFMAQSWWTLITLIPSHHQIKMSLKISLLHSLKYFMCTYINKLLNKWSFVTNTSKVCVFQNSSCVWSFKYAWAFKSIGEVHGVARSERLSVQGCQSQGFDVLFMRLKCWVVHLPLQNPAWQRPMGSSDFTRTRRHTLFCYFTSCP